MLRVTLGPLMIWLWVLSAVSITADKQASGVSIYDPNPQHLWNRLHTAIFVRIGPDGKAYGDDTLEPLLWVHTKHLRSHDRADAILEEFLQVHGENLVTDPVKRAVLQRDLWLVFDWLVSTRNNSGVRSDITRLETLLANTIGRLALTSDQVKELPDNYALAVSSGEFAKSDATTDKPYLPPNLFDPGGPWVCLGREDGPVALGHVWEDIRAYSNSTFLILLRLPAGRAATVEFLASLREFAAQVALKPEDVRQLPKLPVGTEVALVRQALLIDSTNAPRPSSLTESIQLRIHGESTTVREFREFRLSRALLFSNRGGGLRPVGPDERLFKTGFRSHPHDPFEIRRDDEAGFLKSQIDILQKLHWLPSQCYA